MKVKTLSALAGLGGALIMTSSASAAYTGLSVTSALQSVNGVNRNVYRVWANFSNANDFLTVVNGSPTGSVMVIQSRNLLDTAVGGNFLNTVTSHGTAPTPTETFGGNTPKTAPIPPVAGAAGDTYFTIGAVAGTAGDVTGQQSMPNDFILGNSYSDSNAGWFTNGPVEQGRAGNMIDGNANGVLMMQLVVNSTSGVRGTVNIAGVNDSGLAGGTTFVLSGQTFNSFVIPGPGAMALLGVAGLVGSRRRRA